MVAKPAAKPTAKPTDDAPVTRASADDSVVGF
jgi:hypothetical protein